MGNKEFVREEKETPIHIKIKKFDSNLKTLAERISFVDNIVDSNIDEINEYIETGMLKKDRRIEKQPLNITIEQLGNYIIRSSDAPSSRDGEYSFFETEGDYRKTAIGKKSIASEEVSSEGFTNYISEDFLQVGYDRNKLFNFDTMTPESKKKLIKLGLIEKDNEHCGIKDDLQSAYEYIMDMLKNEKDREVVEMLISGMTEVDIANAMGIKKQSVNERLKIIVTKKI